MKNKNILYLVDDYILFHSKNLKRIIKTKINSKALKNGKIANVSLFLSSYKKFLKDNNLNNNIFGDSISIIVNPAFTKVDIDVITNVFNSLNYRKVNIINEMKIYKFNNTNAFINYNINYTIISYLDYYKEKHSYLIDNNFVDFKSLSKLISKKCQKRNIFCFGLNPEIEALIKEIERNSTNVGYHFSNDDIFLLKELVD